MSQLIAAFDVGTTGARTIIFDINGKIVSSAYQEYASITPQPGHIEQEAEQWWRAIVSTSKQVMKHDKIPIDDIAAIAVTNQRETIVPVDSNGLPLYNALVWQDRRSIDQCKKIEERIGAEEIYNTTGLAIDPYFSVSKIMWFKDEKPEIYNRSHKFLLVSDYINHKLTGEFTTDQSNASRTMLFNINKFKWSEKICNELGISIDHLPNVKHSGSIIGDLTGDSAEQLGLRKGISVVAGGGDQQCAALGLGVIKRGLVKATTGTGTFVLAHQDEPKLDPKMRVLCSASVLPNKWVLEASIFTTGALYKWYRDNFAEEERKTAKELGIDVYDLLNKELEAVEPGARGLYLIPHFSGAGAPYWDPNAKGLLYGLTLAHNKRDILRAIIEGVCYEIKKSLEVFKEIGIDIYELRVAGGATRSDVWNQMQADIYGKTVIKSNYEETTALGAAILACIGAKIYDSAENAIENMLVLAKKYEPDGNNQNFYSKKFKFHKNLYDLITNKID